MVCTESPAPTPVVALTLGSCRIFGADLRTPEHQLFASLYLYLCVGVIPTPEGPESRCCATFGSHYQPFRMDSSHLSNHCMGDGTSNEISHPIPVGWDGIPIPLNPILIPSDRTIGM